MERTAREVEPVGPGAAVAESARTGAVGPVVEVAGPVADGDRDPRGLALRDVVVRYEADRTGGGRTAASGSVVAVDGVGLDVGPGEVVALLGPSGCGKSTLLRTVAGLETPASGSVTWDGVDLVGVPVHRRGFGLMFQDGQLFAHRDVAGNVAYGIHRLARDERERRVAELLDAVGLAGFERRRIGTLSGGERQRVALARALAPRPRLLLLDEPLSALDRGLRERLAGDLREVLVASGTTAVFVTHDHDEAFTVADRVAVMDAGRLLRIAPPAELWRSPGSRRAAEFLGYQAFVPVPPGWDAPAGPCPAVLAVGPRGFVVADTGAGPGSAETPGDGERAWTGRVVSAGLRRGVAEATVEVELPVVAERSPGVPGGTAGAPDGAEASGAGSACHRVQRVVALAGPVPPEAGETVVVRLDPAGCAVVVG